MDQIHKRFTASKGFAKGTTIARESMNLFEFFEPISVIG